MQIKNHLEKSSQLIQRLSDVRFAGQVVFVILVLLISWSGVKSIQTNYQLQKQISGLRQQNAVQQLQNNNLALQNEYYNSNQYLELSARQNFGLAAPGEKEIVVPENVALAYTTKIPDSNTESKTTNEAPIYQRNFRSWVDFFLHRQNVQP